MVSKPESDRLIDRLTKYVGLAAAIASAFSVSNPRFFFAFVGVAAALLGFFLVRVLTARQPITGSGEQEASSGRRYTSRQRWAATAGLVGLIAGTTACVYFFWARPEPQLPALEIVNFKPIDHNVVNQRDAAIEKLLGEYATDNGLPPEEVRIAYDADDPQHPGVRQFVEEALESDPPSIRLVTLDLVVRNRGEEVAVLKEITVRVHSALLLEACEEYGTIEVSEIFDVALCPVVGADRDPVPYEVPGVAFSVKPAEEPERLQLDVMNDPSCTSLPGQAIYELDVVLLFDADNQELPTERIILFVPTRSYAIGMGHTGLESLAKFDPDDDCHTRNLSRAQSMKALWESEEGSPSAEELRRVIRAIEQRHPELAPSDN